MGRDENLIAALDREPMGEVVSGWDSLRAFLLVKGRIRLKGVRRTAMHKRPRLARKAAGELIERLETLDPQELGSLELGELTLFEPKYSLIGSATYIHDEHGLSADLVSLVEEIRGPGEWKLGPGFATSTDDLPWVGTHWSDTELGAVVAPVRLDGLTRLAP